MLDPTNLRELEELYMDLIQPQKIIQHFPTDMEFVEWLALGTTNELQWCLKAFEKAQLFNHCTLIKQQIDNRE